MSDIMNSPKTIRLQNVTHTNLSFTVHRYRARTQGSLRRGPMLESVLISRGQYLDVCAHFGVDVDEALRLCDSSPEIRAFKRQGYLKQFVFPPDEVEPQPVVVVKAHAPIPVLAESVTAAPEVAAEPAPVAEVAVLEEVPAVETAAPEAAAPEVAEAVSVAPEADPRAVREPSMDWSENDLRAYARRKGVDLSRAKSKTAVLRAIREKQ